MTDFLSSKRAVGIKVRVNAHLFFPLRRARADGELNAKNLKDSAILD